MSREGRAQPIQPSAWHGFVDPGPGPVGTVPPRATVVQHDPKPRHFYAPQQPPISISGALRGVAPPANPPAPFIVDAGPRGRALNPVQPVVEHGFLGNTPANGVLPPPAVNVDRVDQRGRYRPLDPIVLDGILAAVVGAPPATPPGPFVVPLDERRRFLAALPPSVLRGLDDSDPPQPTVVEPDDRRRRRLPLDPTVIGGELAALIGPFVPPPEPQSVEPSTRRRVTPEPLSISGALAAFFTPFVAPPEPLVVISDERGRRVYPQPVVLCGPAFPTAVVEAIYAQQFGGPNPGARTLSGAPDDGRFTGSPDDGEFVGTPGGNIFGPPTPGRA